MNKNNELILYLYEDAEMAVSSLTELINDLKGKDNKIIKDLENLLKGYERYKKDSENILAKKNVELKEKSGMIKWCSSMGIKKEVKCDNSDAAIADMIIKGISMGSIDMEKKIKNYEKVVDKKELELAKDFYKFSQDNITHLKKYV